MTRAVEPPARCSIAEAAAAAAAAPPPPPPAVLRRRTLLGAGLALGAAAGVQPSLPAHANRLLSAEWEVVELPIDKDVLLLDIAFTGSDPLHGALEPPHACSVNLLLDAGSVKACLTCLGCPLAASGERCSPAAEPLLHACWPAHACVLGTNPICRRVPAGQPPDAAGDL